VENSSNNRQIVLLTKARAALVEAKTLDDVKAIRNQGEAAIRYAKSRRDIGREAILEAQEIVRRAERRLGEMLAGMDGKGSHGGNRKSSNAMLLDDLGFTKMESSRFQAEARVPEPIFENWLQKTRERGEELTQAALIKLGKQHEACKASPVVESVDEAESAIIGKLDSLVLQGKHFGCIYADPPWKYGNQGTRASTNNHYQTMTVEEIAAEPVAQLSADNCHLHLWTTNGFLFEAREIMEAWGFKYKSVFVWVKPQMGMGNYWRLSHEFMLLGVKGSLPFREHNLMSWLEADRTKHSRKPRAVREMIERASPGPYLELYGREEIEGWTVYGNQIERTLFNA
jgi:N6-adenosine-specific RNA methylase IME4